MKLLTSQKNEIFVEIDNAGLNPSQFTIENIHSTLGNNESDTHLKYKENDYFFTFGTGKNRNDTHACTYSPGDNEYEKFEYPGSWALQISCFKKWLSYLKREIEIEDKWKRLEGEINNFDFKFKQEFEEENEKFSYIEYEEISLKIDLIKEKTQNLNITEEQLLKLNQSLDFVKEKAKHLGKVDWKNMFVGIIIQYFINFSITPELVTKIMTIIKESLQIFMLK